MRSAAVELQCRHSVRASLTRVHTNENWWSKCRNRTHRTISLWSLLTFRERYNMHMRLHDGDDDDVDNWRDYSVLIYLFQIRVPRLHSSKNNKRHKVWANERPYILAYVHEWILHLLTVPRTAVHCHGCFAAILKASKRTLLLHVRRKKIKMNKKQKYLKTR